MRTFTTEVLTEPRRMDGKGEGRACIVSSSARDTDFIVRVSDVYPDGRSMLLMDYVPPGALSRRVRARSPARARQGCQGRLRRRLDEPGLQPRPSDPDHLGQHRRSRSLSRTRIRVSR